METPVYSFLKSYAKKRITRLHMPGHKGRGGILRYDITEINGADVLYNESGILRKSQNNAAKLFGTAATLYSAEGSTLCIKAMLGIVSEKVQGKPLILAARNVHKAFVNACAIVDAEVEWIGQRQSLTECKITKEVLFSALQKMEKKPDAIYITSPDYLGNIADIKALSRVAKEFSVPLLVDNAHGAYLKFLDKSRHPIDLGAAMCADSAHKTLPVLTGGAYLHISKDYPEYCRLAQRKMQFFASTSPSYLILSSLDKCNKFLCGEKIKKTAEKVQKLKQFLLLRGFTLVGDEPMKITLDALKTGYSGEELAKKLRQGKIECEFADIGLVTLMFSPFNSAFDFMRFKRVIRKINPLTQKNNILLNFSIPERKMSIRDAILTENETVSIDDALGRICGDVNVACPPAVPPVISGEVIDNNVLEILKRYNIKEINVVKEA